MLVIGLTVFCLICLTNTTANIYLILNKTKKTYSPQAGLQLQSGKVPTENSNYVSCLCHIGSISKVADNLYLCRRI